MQLLKLYLKHFKGRTSTSGFTMIELLLAASLVIIVVTIAGYGLVTIMSQDQKASAEIAGRTNLTRALDFISEDIKSANSVQAATTGYTITTTTGCTTTPIMALTIPSISKTVVYYIKDISASGCTSVWLKPSIIKRVELNTGITSYSDTDNDGNELVDRISNATVSSPNCTPTTPSSPKGFYACIISNQLVNLTLIGTITNSTTTYQVNSNAFARNQP